MFICNNVDNNGVLRVRFLELNVYSSSKACPLALMQHVARVTMQSKERWIVLLVDVAAFGNNCFTKLSQIVGLLIMRHVLNSVINL